MVGGDMSTVVCSLTRRLWLLPQRPQERSWFLFILAWSSSGPNKTEVNVSYQPCAKVAGNNSSYSPELVNWGTNRGVSGITLRTTNQSTNTDGLIESVNSLQIMERQISTSPNTHVFLHLCQIRKGTSFFCSSPSFSSVSFFYLPFSGQSWTFFDWGSFSLSYCIYFFFFSYCIYLTELRPSLYIWMSFHSWSLKTKLVILEQLLWELKLLLELCQTSLTKQAVGPVSVPFSFFCHLWQRECGFLAIRHASSFVPSLWGHTFSFKTTFHCWSSQATWCKLHFPQQNCSGLTR